MKNYMWYVYSTEVITANTVCYDRSSYDYSAVYEFKDSYSEFTNYCQYEEEAWY